MKTALEVVEDIEEYLGNLVDEWLQMDDKRKYTPANMQVYNHLRTEQDDLEEYKKKLEEEIAHEKSINDRNNQSNSDN